MYDSYGVENLLRDLVVEARATNSLLERILEESRAKDATTPTHESGPCAAVPTDPKWLAPLPAWMEDTPDVLPAYTSNQQAVAYTSGSRPEIRQKLQREIAGLSPVGMSGVRTYQQADCPKCLQRIVIDITDAVTDAVTGALTRDRSPSI